METRIALFQKKEIRKTTYNNEWWFVITDVVAALTDSPNPQGYLKDMRRRDPALADAAGGTGHDGRHAVKVEAHVHLPIPQRSSSMPTMSMSVKSWLSPAMAQMKV